MSAREMWAPKNWREVPGMVSLTGRPEPLWSDDVRVLVQEIPEGMPSFKVGDRVSLRHQHGEWTVFAEPWFGDGEWFIPLAWEGTYSASARADRLTLIPRETSRLIRVTGPEDAVDQWIKRTPVQTTDARVRVEVVNDPEGGER